MSAPDDGPVGRRIGPYQVLRELGAGGMGRVYLARSPGGREVAVKVLHAGLVRIPGYRERFAAEAAAAKAVAGLFTASVIEADALAQEPWLATEYVAGPSLQRAVGETGPLDERRVRELAAGLAEALLAIHAAGIVHRDLKPSNVLMSADGPRVIDFGISADLRLLGGAAAQSTMAGTPGYAPPEQVTAQAGPDRPGDVFSLGAVLVFAATGHGPFGEGTHAALLYRVVHEEPDLQNVPATLRGIVAACLAKNPATRPTPAQLLAATAPDGWRAGPTAPGSTVAASTTAYEYPVTQTLVPPGWPSSMPGSIPPGGTRSGARPGLNRRNLLVAGGLAAAAAGLSALGVDLSQGSPSGGLLGQSPEPSGSTPTPQGTSAYGASSLPKAPPPEWTASPAKPPKNGQIATVGDAVFWFPLATVTGEDLLAFDASTGRQLWTGSEKAPFRGTQGQFSWSGVYGSALYGYSTGYDGKIPLSTIFGLDAQGNAIVNSAIGGMHFAVIFHLYCVAGDIAFVWLIDGVVAAQAMTAVSLTGGEILWSTSFDVNTETAVAADSARCYVYHGSQVVALDVHSGKTLWTAAAPSHTYYDLVLVGDALIATGGLDQQHLTSLTDGFLALDTATGKQLWSTANAYPFSSFGSTVYGLGREAPDLTAYDVHSGAQSWQFESPVLTNDSSMLDVYSTAGTLASENLIAIPYSDSSFAYSGSSAGPSQRLADGLLVLDRATGKARWAYSGPPSSGTSSPSPFLVTVSGDTVYAASPTTLYAFKAGA